MNNDAMWQAVQSRDARHDGAFVYGVLTTGVYCRPSCPSRRPLRRNVRFYADPAAAAADGLRPCRRCRPLESHRADPDVALLLEVCRHLDGHVDDTPDLAALGAQVGKGPFQIHRLFKRLLGITPKQYADAQRLHRVRTGLRTAGSVTDAIYDAGYGSSSRLYERSDAHLGMTPGEYRQGGAGVAISYAGATTALGRVMIGATDRGLCFVQFGDDDAQLRAQLAAEFPGADLMPMPEEGREQFDGWMDALNTSLEGADPPDALPLDLKGTAFQVRVWTFLQRIPKGAAMSYGEVAKAIGAPKATRAVASACARNRIAVLVPCHRVIRSGGELGGYRWGLPRKRALLDAERRAVRHAAD